METNPSPPAFRVWIGGHVRLLDSPVCSPVTLSKFLSLCFTPSLTLILPCQRIVLEILTAGLVYTR